MSVVISIATLVVAVMLAFTLGVKLTIHTINKSYVGTMHVINVKDDPETHVFTEFVRGPEEFRSKKFIMMSVKNREE